MTDTPNPESTPGQPPAYPPPVSAAPVPWYPVTGYPGIPVPHPKVPTRKGPWLWVLVGVCLVLAAGIGALGYLASSERAAGQQAAVSHDSTVENLEQDIRRLERLIEVAEDDRDHYDGLLDEEQGVLSDLEEECPAAVQAYVDTAVAGDEAAFERAVSHMITVCHL